MDDVVESGMTEGHPYFATRAEGSHRVPWLGTFELEFATPELNRVAEVWHAKRGTHTMPARRDITIKDLKFALPGLAFMDLVREGDALRYRVRLMGSLLDELVAPMTGKFVDEVVPPHFATKWAMQWSPALTDRRPVRAAGRVEFAGRRWYIAESFYAPLGEDGETPDILMVVAYYHAIEKTEAGPSEVARRLAAEIEAHCAEPVS